MELENVGGDADTEVSIREKNFSIHF